MAIARGGACGGTGNASCCGRLNQEFTSSNCLMRSMLLVTALKCELIKRGITSEEHSYEGGGGIWRKSAQIKLLPSSFYLLHHSVRHSLFIPL